MRAVENSIQKHSDKGSYRYESLSTREQKVVRDNTNRLIYTVIGSDLFEDISDSRNLLDKYRDFIDNEVNRVPFPQIKKSEPSRPTISFLKNGEKNMCMMLIDTSEEFLPEGYLIVDFEEATLNSLENKGMIEDNQRKIDNFMELTDRYLDSLEESN
ncbi:MAG: hypothetical protein XD93_0024 [candidate division WS6 bacterium 34_10]|uniref:Uncharacterized protein n=1 Tax=candidate division WS6 bacterium 34_10 TaxID=1641389 RepID=A0A117M0P1_9BACT|nr:MAG: hypothetical protein XD93_0024 [candidate division WS6 bacterium 34_10]